MREEEEASWFARGEEQQLLRPDELMPLTQTLITPHLAVAFDITTHGAGGTGAAGGAGAGPGAGGFDHGFLSRVGPPAGPPGMHHRMVGGGAGMGMMAPASFADEMDLGSRGGGGSGSRRELTLFPTSGDH